MNGGNDFFQKMCKEATDELANGEKGWRDAHPNTLILAAFNMLSNHLTSRIIKPLWFFSSTVFVGVVAFVINLIASG